MIDWINFYYQGSESLEVEPVGRWFRAWWWHHHHRNGAPSEGFSVAESGSQSEEEIDESSNVEIEDDVDYLRSLDPKEWKVLHLK